MGFVLTPGERDHYVNEDPRNAEVIMPFIGGEEVNNNPDQSFDRYVISFRSMDLDAARKWPAPLEHLETTVREERLAKSREVAQSPWWQFWRLRDELYETISRLSRCLVVCIVSKHLIFSYQPTDRIFSHRLHVFSLGRATAFAVLQSRVHEFWARLLSSTLEERLNYSATDCFETFPFPCPDPCNALPSVEDIGQCLYGTRAQYMLDTQQGLTDTYNLLKDPYCHETRIEELRRLHEDMDRAVLAAYGWEDIPVPPYVTPTTDAERRALEAFGDEIIDRLFVLNAQRAEEEKRQAATGPGKAAPKKGRGRKPKDDGGQRSLLE